MDYVVYVYGDFIKNSMFNCISNALNLHNDTALTLPVRNHNNSNVQELLN